MQVGNKNKNKNKKQPTRNKTAAKSKNSQGQPLRTVRNAPVSIGTVRRVAEPRYTRSQKNGDVTVSHEEFIMDVNGSPLFLNQKLPINPGLVDLFPWLAQMAPLYESYRFESLEFAYESACTTNQNGTVMLAVDYDSSDSQAATKKQLATYRNYVKSNTWVSCVNRSLREDLNKQKSYFVRSGSLAANSDIKLYDVGFLNLAVQGQADTAPVGELYVRYRVRLMTPQLEDNGLGLARSSRSTATTLASTPVITGNAPFAVSGTGASTVFTSLGPYQGVATAVVTGTTLTAITMTAGGGATVDAEGSVVNGAGTFGLNCSTVQFTAPNQTMTVATAAATTTAINVRLGQYQFSLG